MDSSTDKKIVFCDKCGEAYLTDWTHECYYIPTPMNTQKEAEEEAEKIWPKTNDPWSNALNEQNRSIFIKGYLARDSKAKAEIDAIWSFSRPVEGKQRVIAHLSKERDDLFYGKDKP